MSTVAAGASMFFFGRRGGQVPFLRVLTRLLIAAAIAFVLVWIVFLADNTSNGPVIDAPGKFFQTVLDTITISGLYFIVASGFTLIFGLMRTVQMAHGALFLLAGLFALSYQRRFLDITGPPPYEDVGWAEWWLPLVIGVVIVAGLGFLIQQVFLRWNQGQDLRQALITIAISIIMVDRILHHFGGVPKDITWTHQIHGYVEDLSLPGYVVVLFIVSAVVAVGSLLGLRSPVESGASAQRRLCSVGVFVGTLGAVGTGLLLLLELTGLRYAIHRFFIIGMALGVGGGLWLLLKKTRTGMVIRAGVDDTPMVQALGINVQRVFAVAFVLGSALAGLGGVIGGSFANLGPGVTDGNWLLNSLVVVIIGGMGSLGGAAAGSLLYGAATSFSPSYLPEAYSYYAIIATFVILALVLAVRPYGLFGRPE